MSSVNEAGTVPMLVGRAREQRELLDALESGRPELIAVYGRRRVGKTYLIRTFFSRQLTFELTGMRDAPVRTQLDNFVRSLQAVTGYNHQRPTGWPQAFHELQLYLEGKLPSQSRVVVFLDELPWLATRRSGFLEAFEYFWNVWASRQPRVIVVICGSAASWMIAKVLHQKGGLHNRVTRSMVLRPFRLDEARAFLELRGLQLDHKQIIELYMAVGGIPYYLDHARRGLSAAQNIDALFFAADAPLRDEFDKLFAALFENYERHLELIRLLGQKQSGLTRQELVAASRFPSGGNISNLLIELETSGFICRTVPFGRTIREALYRLVDEFTLFYLRWVEPARHKYDGTGTWIRIRATPSWYAWSGYAFENVCLTHVAQIKRALGIAGVDTDYFSWRHLPASAQDQGAQIDLVIDRRDGVMNLCEMKFSDAEFIIDKKYAGELVVKRDTFRSITKTRKALFLTFVTVHGVKANSWKTGLVQNEVTAEALFAS